MWFPLWLDACVVALALGASLRAVADLRRRVPDVTLDTALPHLRGPSRALLVVIALGTTTGLAMTRSDLEWRLGLALGGAIPTVFWVCVVAASTFALGLGAATAWHTGDRRRMAVLGASVVTAWVVQLGIRLWTRPVWEDLTVRVGYDGAVLQTSPSSCGAASAANVARALGQDRTEPEMARRIGTTTAGSSAAQLAAGLAEVGITCEPVEAATRREVGAPAILIVDHPVGGPESHAVALIERDGELEIWDPLYGRSSPTDEDLAAVWPGRALRCRADAGPN